MDALQLATSAVLVGGVIVSFFIWRKEFPRDSVEDRKTGMVRPVTLKDIIVIVLLSPVILTGFTGVVWLFRMGWEGFTRTILLSVGGGFMMGGIIASIVTIGNMIGRRMVKNRKPRSDE